jgi:hypothetical protein
MDARPALPPPSATDGDGVRVARTPPTRREVARGAGLVALVAAIAAGAWVLLAPAPPGATVAGAGGGTPDVAQPAARTSVRAAPVPGGERGRARSFPSGPPARSVPVAPEIGPDDLPTGDPDDLATYVSPDDPEPTMGEVIQALHDIGDHTGLGAFNPPGTSPPLAGIAVPPDFELPPGYVRHHQFTDEGEPLEPILMFSPDAVLRDADGREIALPEDRVVPPPLAPPGLVVRPIVIPPRP